MWKRIEEKFKNSPMQKKVAVFLLENGFGINEEGKVTCNGVEIAFADLARVIGVDRRVVKSTVKSIIEDEELRSIFTKIRAKPFLKDLAKELGLGVIVISVEDAAKPGIIEKITKCIAENGISIRQAIADDPYFSEEPKFTVITQEPITGRIIDKLKKIEGIKSMIIM